MTTTPTTATRVILRIDHLDLFETSLTRMTVGMSSSIRVGYTILDNRPPQLLQPVRDIIIQGGQTPEVDLSEHFSDPDGENLIYTIHSEGSAEIKTDINGDTLTIIPQGYGLSTVEIIAGDAKGETVSCTFRLMVRDQRTEVEIYPNPVTDGTLYLRVGQTTQVQVSISNSAGGVVYSESLTIEPFSPAGIDLSALTAGVYCVNTSTDSGSESRRIVKL